MCRNSADPAEQDETLPGDDTWTIVVAGGDGLRFGERKQFLELDGRSVLQRAVDAAASVSRGVVVVVPADVVDAHGVSIPTVNGSSPVALRVTAGGASRAASVRAGLSELPDTCTVVLVHDAARPLASQELFARVVAAVAGGAAAVVPAVPIADSIRRRSGGPVDRADLVAVQTPQGFETTVLRDAHECGVDATDDATVVEAAGATVIVIEGEPENRKITDPIDLIAATAVLRDRESR